MCAPSARGHGLGKRAIEFAAACARQTGATRIRLTVNKHNAAAIAAYQRAGFVRTRELVADIGGGYVMDDYEFVLCAVK